MYAFSIYLCDEDKYRWYTFETVIDIDGVLTHRLRRWKKNRRCRYVSQFCTGYVLHLAETMEQ